MKDLFGYSHKLIKLYNMLYAGLCKPWVSLMKTQNILALNFLAFCTNKAVILLRFSFLLASES